MAKSKGCERCGEMLVRREKEKRYNFAKRRYCGVKCRGLAQRTKAEQKDCEQCGEALVHKEKEKHCNFAKRRFCRRECARLAQCEGVTIEGVEMARLELAEMLGVSYGCIGQRITEGRNLLTGKKQK